MIFLNAWGGRLKPFDNFIKKYSPTTDIFCFQEVSPELFSRVSETLSDYRGFYEPGWDLKMDDIWYGQAIFLKKPLKKVTDGKLSLFSSGKNEGFMQYLETIIGSKKLSIANVHGKSRPGHKLDTDVRIKQSGKIINFFRNKKGPKIIGGDFNLMPQTKSVKMFEEMGYRNLVKEFRIKSTRNRFTWEQFKGKKDFVKQYFADYVFVSKDVKVKNFEVPNVGISDHLPLILEFEV